jgi:hypothetical protein
VPGFSKAESRSGDLPTADETMLNASNRGVGASSIDVDDFRPGPIVDCVNKTAENTFVPALGECPNDRILWI